MVWREGATTTAAAKVAKFIEANPNVPIGNGSTSITIIGIAQSPTNLTHRGRGRAAVDEVNGKTIGPSATIGRVLEDNIDPLITGEDYIINDTP